MNNERVTLAQELHDGIAQDLVGLGFSIDAILAHELDTEVRADLRKVRFALSDLVDKVRHEIHQLRTSDSTLEGVAESNMRHELQRVFAEILRNVDQHSKATHLSVLISDNGIGGAQERDGSFGIPGVLERITRLHGDIHIDSTELGTTISIGVPLER